MTQNRIIEMAKEADKLSASKVDWDFEWIEIFAKLVEKAAASKERERIFGELHQMHLKSQQHHNYYLHAVMHIRAKDEERGEA